MREAKDRLSEASFLVGRTYYRMRYYPGAIDRFKDIIEHDAEYTRRDAVYFHLAEALVAQSLLEPKVATEKRAEALPYYERLLKEFEQSEYLEPSKKRIAELKALPAAPPGKGFQP
jgi:outer membrane protein assembly factor BamD (BamD/ComL family)